MKFLRFLAVVAIGWLSALAAARRADPVNVYTIWPEISPACSRNSRRRSGIKVNFSRFLLGARRSLA